MWLLYNKVGIVSYGRTQLIRTNADVDQDRELKRPYISTYFHRRKVMRLYAVKNREGRFHDILEVIQGWFGGVFLLR